MMILWELCITFMTIGISAFGGGYAVMPLFQTYLVQQRGWLTLVELADITAISQMTPGPIILNCPTFVGIKMAGILGGIIATVSAVLPSFVLMLILGYFFFKHSNLEFIQAILKGLRPAIVGLILIATLALIKTSLFDGVWPTSISASFNLPAIFAFGVGLLISSKTKLDTFAIVVIGGIIGILSYFIL